ncbi:MAG: amino acid ABC transporter permease [Chloroflexota bacterium]
MGYQPDFGAVFANLDVILAGLVMTFVLAIAAMFSALILGLILALMQMSTWRPLRTIGVAYVQLFRGTPLYIYLFWLYYSFATVSGIRLTELTAGIICLATLYGAYLAEINRGALRAIPSTQSQAGLALGLSPWQNFRHVILPQAVRIVIPPTTNMFAGVIMDTSLVSAIGVAELIRVTRVASSETFRPFEMYTAAGLIYVVVVLGVSGLSAWLERRLSSRDRVALSGSRRLRRGILFGGLRS